MPALMMALRAMLGPTPFHSPATPSCLPPERQFRPITAWQADLLWFGAVGCSVKLAGT